MSDTAKLCVPLAKSIRHCEGKPVKPGIKKQVYYTNKNNIVQWPERERDEYGRAVSAAFREGSSFTLRADEKWKTIDGVQVKNTGTSEPAGEYPNQLQLNKLTAILPDIDLEASSLPAYVNNADCVFIIGDMNGGYRVYGHPDYESKSTVSQDFGAGPTGSASTTLNVEVYDETTPPFLLGAFETEDGIINDQYAQP